MIVLSESRWRADFDGEGGAGHALDAGKRNAAEGDVESGVRQRGVDCSGEGQAARDPWRLGGLPRQETRGLRRREGGGEEMNSGAVFAGVQTEADSGFGVVGKFCAPVEVDGGIRFARGDDLDSAGSEQGTEADVECEVGGFFELAAIEVGAGVVTAMGCVEDDYEAGGRSRGGCLGRGRREGLLCGAGN